jgi:DNA topoisomerase-6 subunit B
MSTKATERAGKPARKRTPSPPSKSLKTAAQRREHARGPATAQDLALRQREISISEFFTKNRHLLGFDSPAKALLTAIKEAVDNSLDACEEAGILPDVRVEITALGDGNGGGNGGGAGSGGSSGPAAKAAGSARAAQVSLSLDADDDELPGPRSVGVSASAGAGNGGGTTGNGVGAAGNGERTGRGGGGGGTGSGAPGGVAREERFRLAVEDNGPGIVREQIPRIFGKLLYGSKFHSLKQSRGQQGIGISAAGMYGQLTTGKPVVIISRTGEDQPAHRCELVLDMKKNEPVLLTDQVVEWGPTHGTRVEIELTGSYKRGQHSVDTYLQQTAVANPHVSLTYRSPRGEETTWPRAADTLPPEATEIQPHPHGVELGLLMRMLKETRCRNLAAFLKQEFCRVGPKTADTILAAAKLPPGRSPRHVGQEEVQRLLDAIAGTRIPAPPTDCLSPIGEKLILAALQQRFPADFHTAVTRPPAVYRGNPFQIEVGIAYGGSLPADELAQVMRFANRVPLLYQASGCVISKSVLGTNWRSYGLQQSRGAPPTGPLVVFVHMASVWVPFTSESKEAVAGYPEIVREVRLALQEAGRQLQRHVRRQVRERDAWKKQSYIQKYIPHIGEALQEILALQDPEKLEIVATLTDTLERSRKI